MRTLRKNKDELLPELRVSYDGGIIMAYIIVFILGALAGFVITFLLTEEKLK